MQSREFIKYVNDPFALASQNVSELEKLVNDFPYFQSAQLLLSLSAAEFNTSLYQKSIRRTAISVPSRERLYDLLQGLGRKVTVAEGKEENKEDKKTEPLKEIPVEKAADAEKTVETASTPKIEKKQDVTGEVEREIEKSLIQSYIQKEVIGVKVDEPNKPVDFSSWLAFLKQHDKKRLDRPDEFIDLQLGKEEKQKALKARQKTIIDKIIESNPGQIKVKTDQKFFRSDSAAKESLLENEHLVTETLAQIYAEQGNIHKAIRAYEILSLKNPQKSAYFASLILKLKNSQKDQ